MEVTQEPSHDALPFNSEQRLAVRTHAYLMMWLLIAAVAVLVLAMLLSRARQIARFKALKLDTKRRRRALQDAWTAAAERAATPSAERLERDRLDLEDTRAPFDPTEDEPPDPSRGDEEGER